MATSMERRRAPRVSTVLPVRLNVGGRALMGETRDMSRIGARIRVPLTELQLLPQAGLAEISARIGKLFGDVVVADLNHTLLGTLVRRSLRVVRLARPADVPTSVDIGCMLRVPLSDDEVGALGLVLPDQQLPKGVYTAHEVFARLKRKKRSGEDGETPEAMAFVSANENGSAPPVRASNAAFTDRGVLLHLDRHAGATLGTRSRDASAMFDRFVQAYGTNVNLLLVRNQRPLWSGTVSLRAVEVDPLRDEVYLEFATAKPVVMMDA